MKKHILIFFHMKNPLRISVFSFFLLFPVALNAQVLITILLGDALNTDKIEFGLVGGLNRSYINTIDNSKGLNNFNLGFYFHILMKNNSYLSTGVLVKSNGGATGMAIYSMGDENFDAVYQDGTLTKKSAAFMCRSSFTRGLITGGILRQDLNWD